MPVNLKTLDFSLLSEFLVGTGALAGVCPLFHQSVFGLALTRWPILFKRERPR